MALPPAPIPPPPPDPAPGHASVGAAVLPGGLTLPAEPCPATPVAAPPPPVPRAAWILAGFALLVRLLAAALDPVPPRDGVALAASVEAAARGDLAAVLAAPHHPLAPLLAAPLAAAGVPAHLALALLAAACGAAAVLPLHALGRRAFGGVDAANAAALLYAVAPPMVRVGSTALAEAPLLLLGLASLDAASRTLRHWRPRRDALLAGLFAGLAFVARPEGLLFLPVALAACLPPGGGRPRSHRGAAAGLVTLGWLAAAGAWLLLAAGARGEFRLLPSKSVAVLAGAAAPAAQGGGALVAHGPGAALLEALGGLAEALHPALVPLVLLGLGGCVLMPSCGKVMGPLVLAAAAAGLGVAGVALLEARFGYGGRRHAAAAAAALLPFAGHGLLVLAGRLRALLRGRATSVLVHGAVTLPLAAGLLAGALLQRDRSGAAAVRLGEALRGGTAAERAPRVGTFGEPRVAWALRGSDVPLAREFGVPPGAADAAARGEALRAFLAGPGAPEFLVLEEGDARVPAGFPGPAWPAPDAREGRLAAWRVRGLPLR